PRVFCAIPGRFARPRWLPDGKAVSFLAASAEGREPAASSLYLCSGEGSHPVNFTEGAPFTVASYEWLPGGRSALMTVIEKNSRYLIGFELASRKLTRISAPGQVVSADFSLSRDAESLACAFETAQQPPDVWTGPTRGVLRQVTRPNPA